MLEKAEIAVKKLLIGIRTLKMILVRAQKEKRQAGDKASILQKYMNSHEQNVGRNMDDKGHSSDNSDGNEGEVIGNWRKEILVIEHQKT